MKIYSKGGILLAEVNDTSYSGAFMGERFVSCTVKSATPIQFLPSDYIDYRGERFVLDYTPTDKKISSPGAIGDAFQYDLKFVSLKHELEKCLFLDVVLNDNEIHYTGLSDVQVFGDAKVLADRILANLNRLYKGEEQWNIQVLKETDAQNISLSDSNCWDAVALFKSLFDLNFTVYGREIKVGTVGKKIEHTFQYGSGNGLTEIVRTAVTGEAVVTRLKAYGGSRNLPRDYNKKGVVPESQYIPNLMLPGYTETLIDYIESDNTSIYGIREAVFKDEEIYPSIAGVTADDLKASGITTTATGRIDEIVYMEPIKRTDQATFNVWIKDIGFNIKNYLTPTTALISMRDGNLGGYEFEITNVIRDSSVEGAGYKLTLNRNQDDNFILPDEKTFIKPGDHFVLLEIYMPEVYVKTAEQRLLTKAQEYLAEYDHVKATYSINMDKVFMANNPTIGDTAYEGDLIQLVDTDLQLDREIIIQNLTIKDSGTVPEYTVTLSDDPVATTLDRVQDNISEIEQTITANKVDGVKEARRRAIELQLLKSNIFDPDGEIKDTFLQTMMLQVGANSMNYQMGKTTARPRLVNMSYTNTTINIGADDVIHFAYGAAEEKASTWHITTPFAGSGLDEAKTYFVAIKASRENLNAEWIVDENTYGVESIPGYYVFNFGILSAVTDGERYFSETRGNIYAYGDELSAGIISSIDRYSWFNLNTGDFQLYNKSTGDGLSFKNGKLTLGGNFNPETGEFGSSISKIQNDITETSQQAANAQNAANEAKRGVQESQEYIAGTILPAIEDVRAIADGQVSSWFYPYTPTLSNYPASSWDTEAKKDAAIGDTFTNTQEYIDDTTTPDAGKSWRWVKEGNEYKWTPIADSDAVKALLKASQAEATADGKSTIHLFKPSKYALGDAWILENDTVLPPYKKGELLNATRDNSIFNSSDWEKRDLSANNAVSGIQIGGVNLLDNSKVQFGDFVAGGSRILQTDITLKVNKAYTFTAQCSGAVMIRIGKYDTPFWASIVFAATDVETVKSITFIPTQDVTNVFIEGYTWTGAGDEKRFCDWLMLVEGNKAPITWSPSLADQQAQAEEEAQKKVDALQIGIRNLILKSNESATGAGYPFKTYNLSKPLEVGKEYTAVINGRSTGTSGMWMYIGGSQQLISLKSDTDKTMTSTFICQYAGNQINIYHAWQGSTGESTVNWCALYEGNKAPDNWVPAIEDTQGQINDAKNDAGSAIEAATNALSNAATAQQQSNKAIEDAQNAVNAAAEADKKAAEAADKAVKAYNDAQEALTKAENIDYLKAAFGDIDTEITSGVVLSGVIAVKDRSNNIVSGIAGTIPQGQNTYPTIFAGVTSASDANNAKVAIYADGSGWLAGKNISWDAAGNATFTGKITSNSNGDKIIIDPTLRALSMITSDNKETLRLSFYQNSSQIILDSANDIYETRITPSGINIYTDDNQYYSWIRAMYATFKVSQMVINLTATANTGKEMYILGLDYFRNVGESTDRWATLMVHRKTGRIAMSETPD